MSAYNTNVKIKKIGVLEKVVKRNPKYAHIESNIDTGSSLTKYMKKLEEIKTNYRYQQNEIFKRMKITTFVQLVLQIANIDATPYENSSGMIDKNYTNRNKKEITLATIGDFLETDESLDTDRHSTLQSVINGVGEQDILQAPTISRNTDVIHDKNDLPYLLLDIRDKDDYNNCHIKTALSYPIAMLSRSLNNETKELLAYKNQDGKIIVIYDEDEKIATRAAATLVERGYDNLFMLSGGLKLAVKKFPNGLISGVIPNQFFNANELKNVLIKEKSNEKYLQSDNFVISDLENLNIQLDKLLLLNDSNSRLSRVSNNSDRKSTYSSASVVSKSSIHSQPWKPV